MKKIFAITSAIIAALALSACCDCAKAKQGRKVAVQMWTTHFHPFDAALKDLAALGVKYVECYPGQVLSASTPKAKFGHNMSDAEKAAAKKMLSDNGIKMISYGCTGAKTEEEMRKICAFVKEFGAGIVVTEAQEDTIPLWDKVCGEFGLKMALHSHERRPSHPEYKHYDPKFLMTLIKDNRNVGICADNGAWSRSGLDVVDGFKSVAGKLFEVHLKDQQKFGDLKSGCAPYGEGELDMKAILAELDRQGFGGFLIIEDGTYKDWKPATIKNLEYLKTH